MARQPNPANLLTALMAEYNFMKGKDGGRRIAQILLANMTRIPDMMLEDVADLCNVSVSTLLRFFKDMGYPSFTYFKTRVEEEVSNYQNKYTVPVKGGEDLLTELLLPEQAALVFMIDQLDRAACRRVVDRMAAAKKVFFYDIRYSTLRISLQCDLAYMGKLVYFSADYSEQVRLIEEMDNQSLLLLCLTNSSRDRSLPKLIPAAKKSGAAIAALCANGRFPNGELCDELVCLGSASGTQVSSMLYPYLAGLFEQMYLK